MVTIDVRTERNSMIRKLSLKLLGFKLHAKLVLLALNPLTPTNRTQTLETLERLKAITVELDGKPSVSYTSLLEQEAHVYSATARTNTELLDLDARWAEIEALRVQAVGPEHVLVARAFHHRARIRSRLHDLQNALRFYRQADKLYERRHYLSYEHISCLEEQADVMDALGDHQQAASRRLLAHHLSGIRLQYRGSRFG